MEKIIQATPAIICSGSAVAALISEQQITTYFFIGVLIFGGLFNLFLKYIIFKNLLPTTIGERPKNIPISGCGNFDRSCADRSEYRSYGFPSGHSQIVAFFAIFWTLYIIDLSKTNYKTISKIIILWILALIVAYSRIYINCHTVIQIIFGFLLGTFLGALYYKIVKRILKNNVSKKW